MRISLFVPGLPGTKGSAKAFVIPGTNRASIVNDNPKAKSWAALVSHMAHVEMFKRGLTPTVAPVRVATTFYLPRPKSHYLPATKKRPVAELRADAPMWHSSKPDGDKMVRAAWDALTGIVFADDSQIAKWEGAKVYQSAGQVGTMIEVATIDL